MIKLYRHMSSSHITQANLLPPGAPELSTYLTADACVFGGEDTVTKRNGLLQGRTQIITILYYFVILLFHRCRYSFQKCH